jgi:hypothetical protein
VKTKQIYVRGSQLPALVDTEDYARVAIYTWRLQTKKSGAVYVVSDYRDGAKTHKRLLHREVLRVPSAVLIDHKDRNGLNNTKANLRVATASQNLHNRPGHKNSTSKFKGVSWSNERNRWCAQIMVNGRTYRLGKFISEVAAAKAYDAAAKALIGEFAYYNF